MLEENNNNFYGNQNMPPQQPYYPPQYNPYVVTQNPEKYEKKRNIRRLGLAIGVPSICLSAIGFLWSFVYFFVTAKFFNMTL